MSESPIRILYGDGVHDDTIAANTLLSGERVWSAAQNRWLQPVNNRIDFPKGTYRLSGTLKRPPSPMTAYIEDSTLDCRDMPPGMLVIEPPPGFAESYNNRVRYTTYVTALSDEADDLPPISPSPPA